METPTGKADLGKSSLGMEPQVGALLSYVLGFITGLIFFLLEKENKFIKFHAMQSILLSLGLMVVSIVLGLLPVLGPLFVVLLQLGGVVVWIILLIKAYQGEWFRLPVLGDVAAKQAGV